MKEHILEIIQKNKNIHISESDTYIAAASEIAREMEEFTEWMGIEMPSRLYWSQFLERWQYAEDCNQYKSYTTSELFNYWKTEVRK